MQGKLEDGKMKGKRGRMKMKSYFEDDVRKERDVSTRRNPPERCLLTLRLS